MSLRARYIAFACSIAVIAALLLGGYNFYWVHRLALDKAYDSLADAARAVAVQVEARYNRMRIDVTVVSETPPFEGIIRSTENGGIDPLDGSTTALWKQRLQTIFKAVMRRRVEYVQMRYIEVADKGMEMVRVDNRDGQIVAVPDAELQQKRTNSYVIAGTMLNPYGVYISNVEQNVERGVPDPGLYVLRAVTQVRGADGELFGLMVINTDFEAEIRNLLRETRSPYQIYVVDESGYYMTRSPDGTISRLITPSHSGYALPGFLRTFDGPARVQDVDDILYSRAEILIEKDNPDRSVTVYIAAPTAEALAGVQDVQHIALGLSLVLVLVSAGGAYVVAHRMTQPMQRAIESISDYSVGAAPLSLPVDRRDEIGDLSRSFSGLVTSLEQARSEEREVLARLQAISDNTIDALITTDDQGTIQSFSRGAGTMFGYAPAEAIGKSIEILMGPEFAARLGQSRNDYKKTGESEFLGKPFEWTGKRRNGTEFPIELLVSEVRVNGTRIFSGIARDITERKQAERQLLESAEALKRSNAELEEFAYIASHDLKEPMRAISNHAQFLGEDHGDALGEDGLKRLARIRDLCKKSEDLVSDLLYFSRIGRSEEKQQAIDVAKTIEVIRQSLADYLEERGAVIEITDHLPMVVGDPSRIKSVFQNLIVNGVKYNDQPQKVITIGHVSGQDLPKLDVSMTNGEPGCFFVRDNGIGIPEEHQARVFTIFKRLHNDKAYGAGSGAGLSFVRKIVEQHGGKIALDSKPGAGSTFYFSLPEPTDPKSSDLEDGPNSESGSH